MTKISLIPVWPALLLAGCISLSETRGTAPSERRAIATDRAPAAIASYSQAILVGDTLYLAGQIGLDAATRQLVPGGLQAEASPTASTSARIRMSGIC